MAEAIQYDVFATLKVAGGATFNADMDRAAGSVGALQGAFDKMHGGAQKAWGGLSTLGDMAAGIAGKIAAVGSAAATAMAVATGAGAMVAGKNLSEMENKSTQLTGIIAAATERSFHDVKTETGILFSQFKSDAVESTGALADFVDAAGKMAAPVLGAGRSMADLREMTKGVIATAPALGVEFKQASSDIMRMLQGGAGAELPFFKALQSIPSLGIKSAEAFNQMALDKRIDTVTKALSNPALKAASLEASSNFSALWGTTTELLTTMGSIALSPAFEVVKRRLLGISDALVKGLADGAPVRVSLQRLGNTLGNHLERFTFQVARLFPDLNASIAGTVDTVTALASQGLARVVSGTAWLVDHWPAIAGGAREFAGWVAAAATRAVDLVRTLGGGDLAEGLKRAAMLYGAAHAAVPTAQMALGGAQMAQGAVGVGKWMMGFGGGTAATTAAMAAGTAEAASAGAAAGAAAASGTAAAAGAGVSGAGAAGASAAAAAGPVALIALAVGSVLLGAYKVITDSPYWSFGEYISSKLSDAGHELEKAKAAFGELGDRLSTLWEAVKRLGTALSPFLEVMLNLYPPVLLLVGAWTLFTAALDPAAQALTLLGEGLQTVTSYLTFFTNKVTGLADALADKLGIRKGTLEPVDEDMMRGNFAGPDMRFASPVLSTSGTLRPGSTPPVKPPDKGKQAVEVTIKWDLGEGNEEAIYVRTRRDLTEALQNARSFVRSGPLPGRF